MSRKYIPVHEAFDMWGREPAFRAEYGSMEGEFTLATALIKARDAAHMTQEDMDFIVGAEIYDHLGKVADRFDDVAKEINSIVIEQV